MGIADWLRDEFFKEVRSLKGVREFLGIKSPSAVVSELGSGMYESMIQGIEEMDNDPDIIKAREKIKYRQWMHYVAYQRKHEAKFKKARIRNGLM